MNSDGFGNQVKPCGRVAVFLIFFISMTLLLYQYYDVQYSTIINYPIVAESFVMKNYNDSMIRSEDVDDGYIVWSPLCQIPNISAYHESIKKFIYKWKPVTCSKAKPLTIVVFNVTILKHTLKVTKEAANDYKMNFKDISCCYWIISRKFLKKSLNKYDDDRYDQSKPVCFFDQTELPFNTEFVYVTCSGKKWFGRTYQTIHMMVVDKKPKNSKSQRTTPKDKKYSVLLFGIDSISRLNFMRTLPQTMRFVEQRGWIRLEGYSKIADNTFPNLIAILTGMTVDQLRKRCWPSEKSKLDHCPFIWKNFSQESYLTAYVEDEASIGTFKFNKYGFLNSPTDYYTRPIMVAGSKKLKVMMDGGMKYCLGQYPQIEYLFQYMTEFVQRLHDRPYFNLFWANSFSHNELNMPTVMDARIRKFLENIQDYLQSTIVVFLSDHGMRFGQIRETYAGWLEERMPFIYFWLPPSFKMTYPEKYINLVANKNRLTSPFDLHSTLQDILYGSVVKVAEGCPKCDSLLKLVSANRSCEDAAITNHWCTCSSTDEQEVSTDKPAVVSAVNIAIQHINDYLKRYEHETTRDTECAVLSLGKIISVRSRVRGLSLLRKQEYVIVFKTKPSSAVFETTIQDGVKFEGVDAISRINMYGNQSSCVKGSSNLRLFCFCVKQSK